MSASLIESPEEHHWVFLDHRLTRLTVDAHGCHLQSWALDGSFEIRLNCPVVLESVGGAARRVDPSDPPSLAPLLALLRRPVQSLTVGRDGTLALAIGGGATLRAASGRGMGEWEVLGGGALEGLTYRATAADGATWAEGG